MGINVLSLFGLRRNLIPQSSKFFYDFLALVSFGAGSYLRLAQLGYSHFYGDEVKTLFLRKDISAVNFLLNQRKGPLQFLISWGSEKLYGGFSEFYIRLPFALCSIGALVMLYLVVKKLFGKEIASVSLALAAFNGLFVAFGRTAQYQSVLLFFGLLAVYLVLVFIETAHPLPGILSALSLGLCFLAHWDAIFFGLVYVAFLVKAKHKMSLKKLGLLCGCFLLLVGPFYFPYFIQEYFSHYFLSYFGKRVSGVAQLPSSSLITYLLYNPVYPFVVLVLGIGLWAARNILRPVKFNFLVVLGWFSVSFLVFEGIIANPGTHIYTYVLPFLILVAYQLVLCNRRSVQLLFFIIGLVNVSYLFKLYLPSYNLGYPWRSFPQVHLLDKLVVAAPKSNQYQVFIYGFPYNRGWDTARAFLQRSMPHSYFTNDDTDIAGYFFLGVSQVELVPNHQYPEYYFHVLESTQKEPSSAITAEFAKSYKLVKLLNTPTHKPSILIYKIIDEANALVKL